MVFMYPENPSVQAVEGFKASTGHLVCASSWFSKRVYMSTKNTKITLGPYAFSAWHVKNLLEHATFTNMGQYSVTQNNCQRLVFKFLARLNVPVPRNLTSLRKLIKKAKTPAAIAAAFVSGISMRSSLT
ncbi:hypothetical protein MTO96_033667 [Rhipicephalus appendiculatus]